MTTNQVEAFLTIASCGSYTKAAKALFISQSNISKMIMSLEDELGVTLFTRRGNKTLLTDAGKLAQESFSYTIKEFDTLKNTLQKYKNDKGFLSVAVSTSLCFAGLLPPIEQYRQLHPEVEIRITECISQNFYGLLDRGEVELAIGWETELLPPFYESRFLYEDSWKLMVSRNNPLAKYDLIDLSIAKNEDFILQRNDRRFIVMCQKSGFRPTIKHNVENISTLTRLVEANYGVGFLCSKMFPVELEDTVKLIRIKQAVPHNLIILTRKEDHSPLLLDFIEHYHQVYTN